MEVIFQVYRILINRLQEISKKNHTMQHFKTLTCLLFHKTKCPQFFHRTIIFSNNNKIHNNTNKGIVELVDKHKNISFKNEIAIILNLILSRVQFYKIKALFSKILDKEDKKIWKWILAHYLPMEEQLFFQKGVIFIRLL